MLNREILFVIMLFASLALTGACKMLGNFRLKRVVFSLIGIIQLSYFCGWDTIHLLVLTCNSIFLSKWLRCHPRIIFIYCLVHRFFFSSSELFGLPRDESNLANATMFVATLKMIIVAYEVHDYRAMKKDEDQPNNEKKKRKWLILDREPTTSEIFCFMTCFVGLFTGPVFRYKTYHDMLYKYADIPVRTEIMRRFKTFVILTLLFAFLYPFSPKYYKDGRFYEHNFEMRLVMMSIVALTQGIKYTICWTMVESMCVLVGLGAYPVSTSPMPGKGPSQEKNDTEKDDNVAYNFDTMNNSQFVETLAAPNVKGTLQNWNQCTQWWLAFFIYSSSIFPPKWKLVRTLATFTMSAALHGIKVGYFMSFPLLLTPLIAETIWANNIEERLAKHHILFTVYKLFTWIFCKSLVFFFLISIFLLQDYEHILKFCNSMYYYGYTVPAAYLLIGLMISFAFPKSVSRQSTGSRT